MLTMVTSRFTKIALIAAGGLAFVGVAAYFAWRLATPDSGLIQVSGRIESDRVTLASKVMGRVVAIQVREGSETHLRQTMALLDDRTTQAQLAESHAAVEAAASQVASARPFDRYTECAKSSSRVEGGTGTTCGS